MRPIYEKYAESFEKAFGDGTREERLRAFYKAVMIRAESVSREQMGANDTPLLHCLRGQNTILFEQADWAAMALESMKGDAKPGPDDGIPDGSL